VALVICLGFGVASWWGSDLLDGFERDAYDLGVRGSSRSPSDRVAVIAIDDQSIANLGRWPWPRDRQAKMVDILHSGGAKVVGSTVLYPEEERAPGLAHIEALARTYQASGADIPDLASQLDTARRDLDTDATLAASIARAGNVALGMTFIVGEPLGNPDAPLPDYIARNAAGFVDDRVDAARDGILPIPVIAADTPPIATLGAPSAGIGHINAFKDVDGANRHDALVLRHYDEYFPSLSLLVAAKSLNLGPGDIKVHLGEGVELGGLKIRTDPFLRMNTFYYGEQRDRPAFPVDSFFDVFEGKIPAEKYRGKIVLIGASATGIGDRQKTPIRADMAPVEAMAHAVSSILGEDFFVTPSWGGWAELGAFALVFVYLVLLFPRLGAGVAAGVSLVLFIALVGTGYALMTTQGMWIKLTVRAVLVMVGHVLLTTSGQGRSRCGLGELS
jgi:serine/threonine-protein kinase